MTLDDIAHARLWLADTADIDHPDDERAALTILIALRIASEHLNKKETSNEN